MLENAISKLKGEMEQNKGNSYIQVVGEFLLQQLDANPGTAEKIVAADKTILKSLDEMRKVAEKKKSGNCAVLTDQEGFEVVLKYFGIEGAAVTPAAAVTSKPAPPTKIQSPAVDFDVKLEDLLG